MAKCFLNINIYYPSHLPLYECRKSDRLVGAADKSFSFPMIDPRAQRSHLLKWRSLAGERNKEITRKVSTVIQYPRFRDDLSSTQPSRYIATLSFTSSLYITKSQVYPYTGQTQYEIIDLYYLAKKLPIELPSSWNICWNIKIVLLWIKNFYTYSLEAFNFTCN